MPPSGRIDLRKSPRFPFSRFVWVVATHSDKPVPLQLIDISDGGARICLNRDVSLPEEFIISFTSDGKVLRRCKLVWRDNKSAGVKFLKAHRRPPSHPDEKEHDIAKAD